MELAELLKISFLLLIVCIVGNAMNIPNEPVNSLPEIPEDDASDEERRAMWLETRSLESRFNDLVYMSISSLVKDGRLSNLVLGTDSMTMKDKRGRFQGFCFRRTRSGRFLPYICWKDDNN